MSVVPVPSLHPPALLVRSPEEQSAETPSPEEQPAAETPSPENQPAGIEVIRVVGWPDPVIDRLGYDPRSLYVETFWLGILGPTCTWLMRRFAAGLDDDPDGFDLALADTARALGLGDRLGRQSPFRRALARCVAFSMAQQQGPTTLAVRRPAAGPSDRMPVSISRTRSGAGDGG